MSVLDILKEGTSSATLEFFEMMCPMQIEAGDVQDIAGDIEVEGYDIIGNIGMSGDTQGFISVAVGRVLAEEIVKAMLGMEEIEDENDIFDTIGEFTNIVSGGTKTQVANLGVDFDITCPSVVSGEDASISSDSGSEGFVLNFTANGEPFSILVFVSQ